MSDEKRRQILKTALEVFRKYGYKRISMNDIAKANGISRPGLYLFFSSKEQVFCESVRQYSDDLIQEILSGLNSHKTTESKLLYAFEVWSVRSFDDALKSPESREVAESNYLFSSKILGESFSKFEAILASVLKADAKSKRSLKAERAAQLMGSALRGFKLTAKSGADLRKMIQDLVTVFL